MHVRVRLTPRAELENADKILKINARITGNHSYSTKHFFVYANSLPIIKEILDANESNSSIYVFDFNAVSFVLGIETLTL